jgi:hypothetical protein
VPGRVIRTVEQRDTESIAYSWRHYRDTMQVWLQRR